MDVKKECKYCGSILANQKRLDVHLESSKKCILYRSMIISCKYCNFQTEYYKDFVKHLDVCEKTGRINEIQLLKDKIKDLELKISSKSTKHIETPKTPIVDYASLSCNDIISKINENIVKIKDSKKYSKLIIEIKNLRINLLKYYNFEQYTDYIKQNMEDICQQFKERKCDDKKIKNIMRIKVLFPIESRMIYYEGFDTTNIDIEHIKFIKECNQIKSSNTIQQNVYNIDNLINYMTTYNVCFIDIKELIDTFIRYSTTLVYLDIKKSTPEDPYSFYYLETITKNKKKWRMDCRLDDMVTDFEGKFREYCVKTFRMIYFKIFGDNEYRSNIFKSNEIFQYECKTLIKNLVFSCNYLRLVRYFQSSIIKFHTYEKSENDVFGLKSDCKFTRDQFAKYKETDYKNEEYNSMSLLFDNIEKEQLLEIYSDLYIQ